MLSREYRTAEALPTHQGGPGLRSRSVSVPVLFALTRIVAGAGVPQLTAIRNCYECRVQGEHPSLPTEVSNIRRDCVQSPSPPGAHA